MAEAVFQITTEYVQEASGLLVQKPGVMFAVIGTVVTEHMRDDAAQQGIELGTHDGIVLIGPDAIVSATQRYVADQQWRRANPEAAAAQDRPQLILPGDTRPY